MALTTHPSRRVAKFGGTSMADANAIRRSASIAIERNADLVVVSATAGTTNTLIEISRLAVSGQWPNAKSHLDAMRERHEHVASELNCPNDTREELRQLLIEADTIAHGIFLLRECSPRAYDRLLSIGERMSSLLCAAALREIAGARPVENVDVRRVLRTDDQFGKAMPLTDEIPKLSASIFPHLGQTIYVTQGFVGGTESGETTTLGRGGSDFSATLLGAAIGASVVEIWTDVAGIATTDPRLCPDARPIAEMTFQEAAELAAFGAKVLHPTTLAPAIRAGIEVFVGSSFEPEQPGTWIRTKTVDSPLVRAMTLKKDQSLLTLTTPRMSHVHGFLYSIFKIFNDHKISVDSITTSEISVALTVDDATLLNKSLFTELNRFAELRVEEHLTLVSLIGNNINHTPGLGRMIFDTLAPDHESSINVRMICLGASKHNFCFLVNENEAPEAVRRLHRTFIESKLPRKAVVS